MRRVRLFDLEHLSRFITITDEEINGIKNRLRPQNWINFTARLRPQDWMNLRLNVRIELNE